MKVKVEFVCRKVRTQHRTSVIAFCLWCYRSLLTEIQPTYLTIVRTKYSGYKQEAEKIAYKHIQ